MTSLEQRVQLLDHFFVPDRHQPKTLNYIIDWVNSLPSSDYGIVDLAAGRGTDVQDLRKRNIPVFGIEPDKKYRKANRDLVEGTVSEIPVPDSSLSGAYLKDTLIFLSPIQRTQMLAEMRRVLVPNGSLLVLSENAEVDRAYFPRRSKDTDLENGYLYNGYPTYEEWMIAVIAKSENAGVIPIIQYATTSDTLRTTAHACGHPFTLVKDYPAHDALSFENRNTSPRSGGFIAKVSF